MLPRRWSSITPTYRCGQPAQQHGRRIPPLSFESAFAMRILLVSALLPEITQQIHSLRASGVMSSHVLSAAGTDAIAFRKSAGSLWSVSFVRITPIVSYARVMKIKSARPKGSPSKYISSATWLTYIPSPTARTSSLLRNKPNRKRTRAVTLWWICQPRTMSGLPEKRLYQRKKRKTAAAVIKAIKRIRMRAYCS